MRLTVSKIITPRTSKRTSKRTFADYSYFDPTGRVKDGETISRNIQWYRMWYLYLRLALELEQERIRINGKLVKVSRRFYKSWDLDSILSLPFDRWWKDHRNLFILDQIEEVKSGSQDKNYIYLKIPKSRNKIDLLNEIDSILDKRTEKVERFPFTKENIPYIRLHIYYNVLVMRINGGMSLEDILVWINDQIYKSIPGVVQRKKEKGTSDYIEDVFSSHQAVTRVRRKAENIILNVCKGIFPSQKI